MMKCLLIHHVSHYGSGKCFGQTGTVNWEELNTWRRRRCGRYRWIWDVKLQVSCGRGPSKDPSVFMFRGKQSKDPMKMATLPSAKFHVQEGMALQAHRSGNLQSWNLEYVKFYFSTSIPATQIPNAKLKLGIKARCYYWLSRFRLVTSQALCSVNTCA
jgi:hypothetical protein